jgi:hypothetical protein
VAGSNASLRMVASVEDRATAPLKAIGQEAKRMGEGFSKSAAALRLVEGAAGQMGGKVADAAAKVSGLAGIVGSGGPLGVAMAAGTALVAAATAAWKLYNADAAAASDAMKSMDESLRRMNERMGKHKDALVAITDELRFFGQSSDEIAIQKGEERLAIIDEEIERNGKLISELARKRYSQEGLGDVDAKQLEALKANNDAMRLQAETIAANNKRLQERIDLQFKESEEQRRAAAATQAAADAKRQQEKEEEERLKRLKDLEESRAKRRADAEAKLTAYLKEQADKREQIAIHVTNGVVETEEKGAKERQKTEEQLARDKEAMQQRVAAVATEAVQLMVSAALSGSGKQRDAAIEAAKIQIAASIAKAAIEAIAAHAGIPFAGVVLGAAAATAIVALAGKYNTGFAHGGTVRGGTPGRDSVPIMAMPGEMVLPVGVANEIRSIASSNGPRSSSGGFAAGGTVSSRSGGMGGGPTIVQEFKSWSPNGIEARRAAREIRRELKTLGMRRTA